MFQLLGVSGTFRFTDAAAGIDLPSAEHAHYMPNFHSSKNKQEMQNEYLRNNKLAKSNKQRNYRAKQRFFPMPDETSVKKITEEENFVDNQQGQVIKVKNKQLYQGHLNKVCKSFIVLFSKYLSINKFRLPHAVK